MVKAAKDLDRGVSSPHFRSSDGKSIMVLVTDDRNVYPMRVNVADHGSAERCCRHRWRSAASRVAADASAVLSGGDARPNEVYAVEGGSLRQLTHQNDAWIRRTGNCSDRGSEFKSKDGTDVHGLLTYPVGYVKGTKVPLLLRIHGGPNGQDAHSSAWSGRCSRPMDMRCSR